TCRSRREAGRDAAPSHGSTAAGRRGANRWHACGIDSAYFVVRQQTMCKAAHTNLLLYFQWCRIIESDSSWSSNMETKAAIGALAALAQDSRLAVFRLLVQVGPV